MLLAVMFVLFRLLHCQLAVWKLDMVDKMEQVAKDSQQRLVSTQLLLFFFFFFLYHCFSVVDDTDPISVPSKGGISACL